MITKSKTIPTVAEDRKRSLFKTFSWRAVASLDTLVLSYLVIWFSDPEAMRGALTAAGIIAALEVPNKLLLYYLHERFWARVALGRVEKADEDEERVGDDAADVPRAAAA